jgi:hypothetical protein
MKPAKTAMLAGAVVGALLFLVVAFLLVRSIQSYNEGNQTYRSERSTLEKYLTKAPFPSEENVELEVSNAEQIDDWFDDVITRLMGGNIQSKGQRSPSKFVAVYGAMQSALNQYARKQNVVVDDSFTYGFDFYSGTGALPAPDDVPRLIDQLTMVTRLSRVLFDARIKQLLVIKRPVFEAAAKASASPGSGATATRPSRSQRSARPSRSSRSRRSSSSRAKPAATVSSAARDVARELFKTERFVITFKARESALMEALNSLATIREFVIVHSVTLSKPLPPLVPEVNAPSSGGAASATGDDQLDMLGLRGDPGTGGAPNDEALASKDAVRYVSGVPLEIPLDVTLELDVYTFLREQK